MKIVGTITRAHFDGGKSFTLRTDHFGTGAGCHCMRETITRKNRFNARQKQWPFHLKMQALYILFGVIWPRRH